MSFDPVIALSRHIALLTLLEEAKEEVSVRRGILLPLAKHIGRTLRSELEQSKAAMRANKMWVTGQIDEGRYGYSLQGKRMEYEIKPADREIYVRIVMGELERELDAR